MGYNSAWRPTSNWRAGVLTILALSLSLSLFSDGKAFGQQEKLKAARNCLQQALLAAREVQDEARRAELLMDVGLALASSDDTDGAHAIAREIGDDERAAAVLTSIGLAHARRKNHPAGQAALKDAEQRADKVADENARRLLRHWIVQGYLDLADDENASRIAAKFRGKYDWAHANIQLARRRLAAGDEQSANAVLAKIAAQFRPARGYEESVLGLVVDLYLETDSVEEALAMARASPRGGYERCRALQAVAEHQSKKGAVEAAALTFAEAFAAAGEIESRNGVRELHMASVVFAEAKSGQLANAVLRLEQIPDGHHKVKAATDVAVAQNKAGNQAAAKATLREALAMVERHLDDVGTADTFVIVAKSQMAIGEKEAAAEAFARALQAARLVTPGSFRSLDFVAIAEAQLNLGDQKSAEATLRENVALTRRIEDLESRSEECEQLTKGAIRLGFRDLAKGVVHDVLLPTLSLRSPNDWSETALLMAVAGSFSDAYVAARKATEGSFRAAGIRNVAAYQALADGPDVPKSLAEKETDPLARCAIYLGTALGLMKARGIDVEHHYGATLISELD
jgi:tetratricopeptide (TPR) repeat protein